MIIAQDDRCAVCEKKKDIYCVDHDHITGKIRGLLCRKCNVGLGMFEDNTEVLANAVRYLMRTK